MSPVTCPICDKRISDWMVAWGKCVYICGKLIHAACVKDLTLAELEQKLKDKW